MSNGIWQAGALPAGVVGAEIDPTGTPPGEIILSYVDFVPNQAEKFGLLIGQVNEYLAANPGLKPKSVEINNIVRDSFDAADVVDPTASSFSKGGKWSKVYTKCLRLWVESKKMGESPDPVVISYITGVPARIHEEHSNSTLGYEEFHVMMGKLNIYLQQNPIQGKILNMTTDEIKLHSLKGAFDPEETFWEEMHMLDLYLTILRVVYIVGPPAHETIGAVDFVPACLDPEKPKFEGFVNVEANAHNWIKQNSDKRFVNAQTVQHEFDWGSELDTQETVRVWHGNGFRRIVRILRVYFTTSAQCTLEMVPHFTSKVFHPACTRAEGCSTSPEFEIQPENLTRVMAWLNYTRAKVFAVETVSVLTEGNFGDIEDSVEFHSLPCDDYVFVVRLFLDGEYQEPPPEVMPPLPEILEGSNCCTIM